MKKFSDRELHHRVDEVLFYIWDPIGVADEPCARGEYRSYVHQVLAVLEKTDTPEPISTLLNNIVDEHMGLSADREKCAYVAELLLRHKQAVKDGIE